MDNGKKICCEHCFITCIGQLPGPVDFSDFSLLISLQSMEGEIDTLTSCGMSSYTSKVGMLDKSSQVKTLEKLEFSNLAFS